jgi:hypothetical protein
MSNTLANSLPREFYPPTETALLAVGRPVPIIEYTFQGFNRQKRRDEVLIMLLDNFGIQTKAAIVGDENSYLIYKRAFDQGAFMSCNYYFIPIDKIGYKIDVKITTGKSATITHIATDA